MATGPSDRHRQRTLVLIFAALYFVQGTAEPTAGLVSQPVRSLLRHWGKDAGEIAAAMLIIGFPWNIKPIFGLLTDFLPIRGYRRKSWFIITSIMTMAGLFAAAALPLAEGAVSLLVLFLFLPSIGIAFTDVVTDAYMVDTGQPLGITGRLQSAQWTAIYAAGLLTGVVGGYLSEHALQRVGFLICATLATATLYIAVFHVHERPEHRIRPDQVSRALHALWDAARTRPVLVIAGFLFFINFNPFSADVLYYHMTTELGFSEQFVGATYTLNSVGAIVAGILYGIYSPRVPVKRLIHASIAFMVLSSLIYLGMRTQGSASVISVAYGFIYLTTTLIQLDLAARFCPPLLAGTVFAALMSISNLSVSSSAFVGGRLYTSLTDAMSAHEAFTILVLVGGAFTALCWPLYHFFPLEAESQVR